MSQKHIPGKGCKCEAWSEDECGCGVDWRSAREVELEGVVDHEWRNGWWTGFVLGVVVAVIACVMLLIIAT